MIKIAYHSDFKAFSEEPHWSKSEKKVLAKYNKISDRLQADQYNDRSPGILSKVVDAPRSLGRKVITGTLALGSPAMAYEFHKSNLMRRGALPDRISESKFGRHMSTKMADRRRLRDQKKLAKLQNHEIIKSQLATEDKTS